MFDQIPRFSLFRTKSAAIFIALSALFVPFEADAQTTPPAALASIPPTQPIWQPLAAGELVATRFGGKFVQIYANEPPPAVPADNITLDPLGVSAQILNVSTPRFVWDARVWPNETRFAFSAAQIGQVFGVAIDDAKEPNIYFAATSAFGLPIVAPDPQKPGRLIRLKQGRADAQFMSNLFGPAGGPGTIWRVDGKTGVPYKFADIQLNGQPNPGPGLGNLTYDAGSKQIFVSDLSTGMIHRLGIDGVERETFDHGTKGRPAMSLPPVPHDPAQHLDIRAPAFLPEDPRTFNLTPPARRVHGLGMHEGRLYYGVLDPGAVYSIGFTREGKFAEDIRLEAVLPPEAVGLAITDMVFTRDGHMVLAQRGNAAFSYEMDRFAEPQKARTLRYRLRKLLEPGPGRWYQVPEDYAVGFPNEGRNSNGGLALNYGYDRRGLMAFGACETTLWSTGEKLRNEKPLEKELLPGGPMDISGLQGMPVQLVKPENGPPWRSYQVDIMERALPAPFPGEMGDVATFSPCAGGGGAGGYYGGSHTYFGGGGGSGGGGHDPICTGPDCVIDDCVGPQCNDCRATGTCWKNACLDMKAEVVCQPTDGGPMANLSIGPNGTFSGTKVRITSLTAGVRVTNGPTFAINPPPSQVYLSTSAIGRPVLLEVCLYDEAAAATGKPYDCCRTKVDVGVPANVCRRR